MKHIIHSEDAVSLGSHTTKREFNSALRGNAPVTGRPLEKGTHNCRARRASAVLLALGVGWLGFRQPASGATLRWTGADPNSGAWSAGANWDSGTAPVDGDTLVFPAGAARPANVNDLTGLRLTAIRFSGTGGGYALSGNGVTLTNSITATNSNGNNTIALTRITLGKELPFTVAQSGATLLISSEVRLNGYDLSTKTVGDLEISGIITGTGGVIKTNDGTLTLSGLAANTFSGDVQVNAGVLEMNKSSGLAVPHRLIVGDGLGGPHADKARNLSSNQVDRVTVNGSGLWELRGNTEVISDLVLNGGGDVQTGAAGNLRLAIGADVTINPGALPLSDAASISGNLELLFGAHNFTVGESLGGISDSTELIIDADISGLGVISKEGPGDILLSGNNSFEGNVNVNAGEMRLTSSTALGTTLGGTFVNNDATLWLQGNVQISGEHLTLNSTGLTGFGGRPALEVSGPSNVWAGLVTFQIDSRIGVATNGFLDLSDAMEGAGSLIKEDVGTMRFSGSDLSRFVGNAFINGGVLELDHSLLPTAMPPIPGTIFVGDDQGGPRADVLRNLSSYQVGAEIPLVGTYAWSVVVNGSGLWDLNGNADFVSLLELHGGGDVKTGANGIIAILIGLLADGGPAPDHDPARISGNAQFLANNFPIEVQEGDPGNPSDLIIEADTFGGSFMKLGTGNLQLSGANTFTGPILVSHGELRLNSPDSLGNTLDLVTVINDATLWLQGDIAIGDRPLFLNSSGADSPVLKASGTNSWSGDIFLAQDTRVSVATNGVLRLSGAILGPGGVVKESPGNLTYLGGLTNTYTGLTSVQAGRLVLAKTGGLAPFAGNLLVGDGEGGPNADIVECTSAGLNANNSAVLVTGSGLLLVPDDAHFGSISGDGRVQVGAVMDAGFNNLSTRFDGLITGSGVINKVGTGKLTLTGSNTIAAMVALDGKLIVNGRQTNTAIDVLATGLLGGVGSVGPVLAVDGTVSPGESPGELETGDLFFSPDVTLVTEMAGPDPGTGYDRLKVQGKINLGGAELDVRLSYVPAYGQVFTIIENEGFNAVNGTFAGLPEGAIIEEGAASLSVSYRGGPNGYDVTLTTLAQPCPPPLLAISVLTNGQVLLSWTGCPSNSYQVAVTTNFQTWELLTPPLAAAPTNSQMTLTVPATSPCQFFRLVIQPLNAKSTGAPTRGVSSSQRINPVATVSATGQFTSSARREGDDEPFFVSHVSIAR